MTEFLANNGEVILRLLVAVGLGMLVGLERVLVHKEAGMKTHALVSMGSALFVIISESLTQRYISLPGLNPTMIISQIVVGIGFLGAGLIIFQGSKLTGLTTAGALWVTAGIGMAAGVGLLGIATLSTLLVFFILVVVYFFEAPLRKLSEKNLNENNK